MPASCLSMRYLCGFLAIFLTMLTAGCAEEQPLDAPSETESGCDPLDPSLCLLPFPSAYFLSESDTVTGWQVAYGEQALPKNRDGVQLSPFFWNEKDGASINSPMLFWFDDVSLDGVVGHQDIGAYTSEEALTVVVDTTTGDRVPHWVELDATAPEDGLQLMIIRPAAPLEWNRRYVVGIRGLTTRAGGLVVASEAFSSMRDGTPSTWDVESRRERFDNDVFPTLEAQGFERQELQLAWDFHTASHEGTLGRMEWLRDDALERMEPDGPAYVLDPVESDACDDGQAIGREVTGQMTVPLYTEIDGPNTVLTRDEQGWPFYNGDTEVEFIIRIPCSVLEDPVPAPIVQYGHGLLGDIGEIRSGYLSELAHDNGWILFGVNWTGMSLDDSPSITVMTVMDPPQFAIIPERSMQGMIEAHAAMRLMTRGLMTDPALSVDGVSVIDATRRWFYGNSQGAIMGGAYVAMSPDVHRAVLGVGGAPYSLLLPRSADFDPFFLVFKEKFEDHRDIMLFVLGLIQQLWDPAESGGWLWDMTRDAEIPNEVLLQVAIGDAQVSTLGAHVQARAYGASTVLPETRSIFGLDERDPGADGFEGNGIVEWRYTDIPEEPVESIPPDSAFDPHECPRRDAAGLQQLRDFLEGGVVQQYCDGVCESVQATCH